MTGIRSHFIPWLQYLWRRFIDDECMRSAAALTYMSLFALVPLMTVMYAMLSAIPDFQASSFDRGLQALGREWQHLSYLKASTARVKALKPGHCIADWSAEISQPY